VSVSVSLPLHHKVQKFSSGTGSRGWSRKKGRNTVVVWWWCMFLFMYRNLILLQAADKSLELLGALRNQRDKKGHTVTGL